MQPSLLIAGLKGGPLVSIANGPGEAENQEDDPVRARRRGAFSDGARLAEMRNGSSFQNSPLSRVNHTALLAADFCCVSYHANDTMRCFAIF
ncbi:hypothetical protein [Chromobacterium subtsugae]|uniref:hypothetical protein n=1 Tax=Chromobacterium subtsugae TaxID=251747 RepID=UPI000ADF9E7C|nr:hypothetical protein [Chromobacterium subtsugae]